jgi:HTH-type transcriptional regulator/antitoxin HipB
MARSFVVRTGKDLGGAARQARLSAGLTQEQVAESVGVDRSYLARIESGLTVVLLDRVMRVLRQLGAEVTVTFREHSVGA